jgi:(Z)-2-((N-methylformamido)methylene)-5-hydroxybutyrolactone dehydrogenase
MSSGLRAFPHLFVGGRWVEPRSGSTVPSIDPSTATPWADVARGDRHDVDAAVAAARGALDGPWSKTTASGRGALILRLAELVRENVEALAELESRDNGKTYRDTKGEVTRAAEWLTFFAGAADKINGATIPVRPDALAYTVREPVGVIAAITPWNSPLYLATWKLGPALAAGNTIVLKPAAETPVTALALAGLAEQAGFPPGVVNVVTGGADVGAALAEHDGVDKVTLTGGFRTAQAAMRAAAGNLKRVTFECGGKPPHIVFDDADVDAALTVATVSAFRSTGQSCALGSRLFVQRGIYHDFVERLVERAQRIRPGLPFDPASHIGPQTTAAQLDKTLSYIDIGQQEGARLVLGGGRPSDPALGAGYFVEPTIFTDVDNRSRLAQDEIFGPVLSVIAFDTEEEVVRAANDTPFGLVAGLWTRDLQRGHRVASGIRAGLVSINTFRPIHWMLPYGGFKMSGIGRENGLEVLHEYTETKTVFVELSTEPPVDPFA